MSVKIVLIGARSHRQGTGPFIAAGLAAAGAEIAGIVGTSDNSVAAALRGLEQDWGIATNGYTDLATALELTQPDAVAICSPWRFHAEQLAKVAAADCHCLVEKPLAWPASEQEVAGLIDTFDQQKLLLEMVSQWPTTLPAFTELHGPLPDKIDEFCMRLSPISIGQDMVTDSAPHFISMLQALLGPGELTGCEILNSGADELAVQASYQHHRGSTVCRLLLATSQQRPRPAWYSINGLRADRRVVLPDYQQFLVAENREVPLTDPMHLVTQNFICNLGQQASTASQQLLGAHRNLLQLADAWV